MTQNTIGIEEVIAHIKLQLNVTHTTEYDDYFTIQINEGLRHLDCLSLLVKKTCQVEICDNKAELPCGFVRLLAARTNGDNWGQMIYSDLKFLARSGCDTQNVCAYTDTFQINNGYIIFNNITEAESILVAYLGYNTDDNGRLLIYEDYERALVAYSCYKFGLSFFESVPSEVRRDYKSEWINQKAWIKGMDARASFQLTKLEIHLTVNAMCINPIDLILQP